LQELGHQRDFVIVAAAHKFFVGKAEIGSKEAEEVAGSTQT
jgi:hypothetical protein